MHHFAHDHDDAIFIRFAFSTSCHLPTNLLACFDAAEKREPT